MARICKLSLSKAGALASFKIEGNSHFYVLIFDVSATGIDYSFDVKLQVPKMEDIESDDNSLEILGDLHPSQKTRKKSPLSCPLPNEWAKTNPSSSKLEPGDPHFRAEVTKATGTMSEK